MKKSLFAITLLGSTAFYSIANAQTAPETPAPEVNKQQEEENKSELRANFKKIGANITSTNVKNGDRYQNSSVSELSADNETVISGVFDFALEYEAEKYRWDQIAYAKYGRKKTKAVGAAQSVIDENDDEIRFETDYSRKVWKWNEADIGPFGNLGYQTEFTRNKGSEKTQVVRAKSGIKLFNGKYIKSLYIAGVGEYDMTFNPYQEKFAMEVGGEFVYPVRDGVDFKLNGYYRDYMHFSEYHPEDLKYDLNVESSLNVKVVGRLSVSPFVSYRYAESRIAKKAGSNFKIGVSFAYDEIFKL